MQSYAQYFSKSMFLYIPLPSVASASVAERCIFFLFIQLSLKDNNTLDKYYQKQWPFYSTGMHLMKLIKPVTISVWKMHMLSKGYKSYPKHSYTIFSIKISRNL